MRPFFNTRIASLIELRPRPWKSPWLSNEEAAERLGKTTHAIKFQLHRVYQKLGVPNRSRLALLLRARGGGRSA